MPPPEALELFTRYRPLADRMAYSYGGRRAAALYVDIDDLRAAAWIGLWAACQRADLAEGDDPSRFAKYAVVRIRGAMLDEMRAQDPLTRRQRQQVSAGAPDIEMLVLFDAEPSELDRLGSSASPEQDLATVEIRARLSTLIDALPERERQMARWYIEGLNLKQIAAKLGLSGPRVSQLFARVVRLLKEAALTQQR